MNLLPESVTAIVTEIEWFGRSVLHTAGEFIRLRRLEREKYDYRDERINTHKRGG
jgi:hypothetical protein